MRVISYAALLTVLPLSLLHAQWHLGLELGSVQYRGATRDTSASAAGTHVRPDHATTLGVRVGRRFARVDVALRALLGTPGIAGSAPGLTFTDRTTGHLLEIVPLVGVRVARVSRDGVVRLEGGPAVDVWDIDGEMRARTVVLGALAYEWPVAGRFMGSVRAEGTLGGSVFDADELPPQLEPRPTWRYGVTLGLRYLFSRQHPSP
ncbi:MAG: hypothetical protein ACREMC_04860 [Gemmatimonadales bacterium]